MPVQSLDSHWSVVNFLHKIVSTRSLLKWKIGYFTNVTIAKRFILHRSGSLSICQFSALLLFWPLEDSAELADGPTGCGEMGNGRRLLSWNFSVPKSSVRSLLYSTEAEWKLDQHDAVVALVTHSYSDWPTDWRTYVLTYLLPLLPDLFRAAEAFFKR